MSSRAALMRLSLLVGLISGCALLPWRRLPAYWAIVGNDAVESTLATLELGPASVVIVDDMYFVDHADYDSVKLPAGVHRLEIETTFGVSILLDGRSFTDRNATTTVLMEAGHGYRFMNRRPMGTLPMSLWIEDAATGAVVAGEKRP